MCSRLTKTMFLHALKNGFATDGAKPQFSIIIINQTIKKDINQYYAPKTLNGAMISASIQATERSFLIISYYPYNQSTN